MPSSSSDNSLSAFLRELRELDGDGYRMTVQHAAAVASLPCLSKLRLAGIEGEMILHADFLHVFGRHLPYISNL